jgi:isoleucyl-tRNA synthetase
MRCSDALIGRLQEAYRKIRNTIRYLLGNLNDFDFAAMKVDYPQMYKIDQWAMQRFNKLISEVLAAYETFAFHRVFSLIYNFCVVDMSSIYMDVLKDRMYCDGKNSLSRRSAQTAMHAIADGLVRLLAPVLVHTSEETFEVMGGQGSIHLQTMPKPDENIAWQKEDEKWSKIMAVRDEALKALEGLRNDKIIASNLEASLEIKADDCTIQLLNDFGAENFAALCVISEVKLQSSSELKIKADKSSYQKCARCWNYWQSVGSDSEYPDICSRCAEVVKNL